MTWQGIEGHDAVVEQFRRRLAAGRLASTFLFIGPAGIGKRTFAFKLAQTLLCERSPATAMEPCGTCPSCRQVTTQAHQDLVLVPKPANKNPPERYEFMIGAEGSLSQSHPDLSVVMRPIGKSHIPIELLIGHRERRMREGLCHDIALKPNRGSRKIAIIDDADYFNQEGANCLLKTLEEPPSGAVLILLGTSEQRQLSTIRSRSQIVRFAPLETEHASRLILELGLAENPASATELANLAGGSLELARELADEELREFRKRFLARLAQRDWDSVALAKAVSDFVDEAGKDAPSRRARLRQLIRFAIDLFRHTMLLAAGVESARDPVLQKMAREAMAAHDEETPVASIERSLEALQHVASNANLATLIECWLDDLAAISRGEPVPLESV